MPAKSTKVTTSGQMRTFLVDTMVSVREGKVDADTARNIVKVAAQINESLHAEIRIAKAHMDLNNGAKPFEFGNMALGDR